MKTKETLEISWIDFQKIVKDSFQNAKTTHEFSDVSLACDDGINLIEAHRIILATGSSFFQRILSKRTVHHPHPLLYLGGVRRSDLEAILDFLYHGQTKVPQMELLTFLQTARIMEVKGLQSDEEYTSKHDTDIGLEGVGDKDSIEGCTLINGSVEGRKMLNRSGEDKKALTSEQSGVWRFMDRLDCSSAQCKICGMVAKCIAGNTSNLIDHIFKNHQKEAQTVRNDYLQLKVKEFNNEEIIPMKNTSDENHCEEFDCEEFNSEEFNSEEFNSEEFYSEEFNTEKFNSDEFNSEEFNSEEFNSEEFNSEEFNSEEFSSEEFNSEDINSDINEELPMNLNKSQIQEGLKDGEIITFPPDTVINKRSLAWQFFTFQGTKEMGPDVSAVHCSLCSNKYKYNETSLTSNLIKHLKSLHREELHAAKVKESRETVIKEIACTEDSNTDHEEVKKKVVEEDEATEDKSVNTFNPTLVLDRNPKSLCWNFFFFKGTEEDGAVRSRVYCNICNMSQLYSGSTTALTSHVRKKHQNELKKAGIKEIDRLAKELQQSSPVK